MLGDQHPPEPYEPGESVPEPEPPPESWEEIEPDDEPETGIVSEETYIPGVPDPLPEEEPGEFGDPIKAGHRHSGGTNSPCPSC